MTDKDKIEEIKKVLEDVDFDDGSSDDVKYALWYDALFEIDEIINSN